MLNENISGALKISTIAFLAFSSGKVWNKDGTWTWKRRLHRERDLKLAVICRSRISCSLLELGISGEEVKENEPVWDLLPYCGTGGASLE